MPELTQLEQKLKQLMKLKKQLQKTKNNLQKEQSKPKESKPKYQYIDVKFKEKQDAKKMGAKWDYMAKSWYIPQKMKQEDKQTLRNQYKPKDTTSSSNKKVAKSDRVYLNIPFKNKEDAKKRGAKWDADKKSWYVSRDARKDFPQYQQKQVQQKTKQEKIAQEQKKHPGRVYINVPFKQKQKAKEDGAKWDPSIKSWYVTQSILHKFQKYKRVPILKGGHKWAKTGVIAPNTYPATSSGAMGRANTMED